MGKYLTMNYRNKNAKEVGKMVEVGIKRRQTGNMGKLVRCHFDSALVLHLIAGIHVYQNHKNQHYYKYVIQTVKLNFKNEFAMEAEMVVERNLEILVEGC